VAYVAPQEVIDSISVVVWQRVHKNFIFLLFVVTCEENMSISRHEYDSINNSP